MRQLDILIVEDGRSQREMLRDFLVSEGHRVMEAENGESAIRTATANHFDLVLLDYKMPGMNGLEVLKEVKKINREIDVVIITAYGTIETAVEAIKAGAIDYITKPVELDELLLLLERITERRGLIRENELLKKELEKHSVTTGKIIYKNPRMIELVNMASRVAASRASVLIQGESGTGKEVMARLIHQLSPRAHKPLIVVNCGALPENLLESELFGHEKGAFTGAVSTRPGVFEQAHRGTLLIDEIGDLELDLQPKLLRAIQRMEVLRVGSRHPIKVDVRVIAATRRDLDREIQAGRFRDDLFFRLNVARIELPPLRRRKGDAELLARHFCMLLGAPADALPERLLRAFHDYEWPGNVRELRNAVSRFLALGDLADFGPGLERGVHSSTDDHNEGDFLDDVVAMHLPLQDARQQVVEEFERRYVQHAIERHAGSTSQAATEAGVAKRYFRLLRARYTK